MNNKRSITRIALAVDCFLIQQDLKWKAKVMDISLKGMRIKAPATVLAIIKNTQPITIRIPLGKIDGELRSIEASARLAHMTQDEIEDEGDTLVAPSVILGCELNQFDVQSLSELRRLVLLNSGNDEQDKAQLDAFIMSI